MRYLIFISLFFCSIYTQAARVVVSNPKSLKAAVSAAKPGDTVLLRDIIWNNVLLEVIGKGTKEKQASVDIVGFASSMPQKEASISSSHVSTEAISDISHRINITIIRYMKSGT